MSENLRLRLKIVVKLRLNRGRNCAFDSVNSQIIGRKFTKCVHDVAVLLPLNLLKADLRSTNPLSNAKA